MSVSHSQVLGTSTAIGGIAMLPYTGESIFFTVFQFALKISISIVAVLVTVQLLAHILVRKHTVQLNHTKKLFTKNVIVQLILLYTVIGLLLGFPFIASVPDQISARLSSNTQLTAQLPEPTDTIVSGKPIHVRIPHIHLDIPVIDGKYEDGVWQLSNNKVLFATVTSLPNNSTGNSVLYGHNTSHVLLATKDLSPGDLLYVDTQEGNTFVYTYTSDQMVQPDDTSVLKDTITPQVTLITCNGVFNSHRRVMTFLFSSVETH